MRRFPVTPLILIAAVVAVVGCWMLFAKSEHDRYVAVERVRHSRSEVRLNYAIDHAGGPISREEWHLTNIDGKSTASYSVSDRKGTTARFDEKVTNYDVTFLFERLVQDGIWSLPSRPFRGKDTDIHEVRIEQVADTQSGSHHFNFTDPHYLATTAGREYRIHLDRNKPVPDLVSLDSTATADDRYQRVVNDFEGFGSPQFRRTIEAARRKLLKS